MRPGWVLQKPVPCEIPCGCWLYEGGSAFVRKYVDVQGEIYFSFGAARPGMYATQGVARSLRAAMVLAERKMIDAVENALCTGQP